MELLSAYIYNTAPIEMTNIRIETLENLRNADWFDDERSPARFAILNKRFNVNDTWYRVVLRFKRINDMILELDTPIPFMIVQSEMLQAKGSVHDISIRFRDLRVWHGREVGSTIGYFQQGVPHRLIDLVIQDLKSFVVYEGDNVKVSRSLHANNISNRLANMLEHSSESLSPFRSIRLPDREQIESNIDQIVDRAISIYRVNIDNE
jgi:hypothetical protein